MKRQMPQRRPAGTHGAAMWRTLAATLVMVAGCDAETATPSQPTITPPLCTLVKSFGNSATCGVDDSTLAACGSGARRTCAGGWLCFDAPEYVDCSCVVDADCAPRTAYINAARTASGKAPLASLCVATRCQGIP